MRVARHLPLEISAWFSRFLSLVMYGLRQQTRRQKAPLDDGGRSVECILEGVCRDESGAACASARRRRLAFGERDDDATDASPLELEDILTTILETAYRWDFASDRMDWAANVVARLGLLVHAVLLATVVGLILTPGTAVVPIDGDPTPRLRGIFPVIAPDLLGFMAVIGLLYLAARVYSSWTFRLPGVRVGLAVAYVVVLLLTRARVSLLLLVIGLVVLMVQDARSRTRLGFLLPLFGVAAVCVVSLYAGQITTFVSRGESSETMSTLTGRTVTWHQAEVAWAERPLTGTASTPAIASAWCPRSRHRTSTACGSRPCSTSA